MLSIFGTFETAIIGSGIAGSCLAYELEKRSREYLLCTPHLKRNTSSKSYGHCRIAQDLEELIRRSVEQLGEDEEKMRFVYSRSAQVLDLLEELDLPYTERSFGVIPTTRKRGGAAILGAVQERISHVHLSELVDFTEDDIGVDAYLRSADGGMQRIRAGQLVLATGGYAHTFPYTDTVASPNRAIFSLVERNGGRLEHLDCVFLHPFGYRRGKSILIGKESKTGEFVDDEGEHVFAPAQRNLVKNDNYHEIFDQLLEQADACRGRGSDVFFVSSDRRETIVPTAHYTSGGIVTNPYGRVEGMNRVYALGECQANGSKNNGRFPGYPYTAAIVQARALASLLWRRHVIIWHNNLFKRCFL